MTSLKNRSRKRNHLVWSEDVDEEGEGEEEGVGKGEENTPSLLNPIVKYPAITKVTRVARTTTRPVMEVASPSTATGPTDLERVLEGHSSRRSVEGGGLG